MTRTVHWPGASATLALAILFGTGPAFADVTKDQCIDANGQGQELRREGKLTAAREQLRQCTTPACPAMVRDDCAKRLDDLDRAQPTIAFEVKDATGADISAVKVTVDGKPLAERLDGTAVPVDIGEHAFTFEVTGRPPLTRTLVLTEGEKGRRERVIVGALPPRPTPSAEPAAVSPTTVARPSAESPPEARSTSAGMGSQRVLGLVAGGVGVAGLAVGGVFGLKTLSQISQQRADCASPTVCPRPVDAASDHSAGETDRTISTVGFIAGGAVLVGGAILFLTAHHASDASAPMGMVVVPSVGRDGAAMFLKGDF